jgi:hypothetical protein
MTPFGCFLNAFAQNDIVAKHLSLKSIDRDSSAAHWVSSLEWPSNFDLLTKQADLVSYVIDGFWRHGRTIDSATTLAEIEAVGLALTEGTAKNIETSAKVPLGEAVTVSVAMLRFLHGGYSTALNQSFLAGYVMGSLGYGAFFATGKASDIDLFLVAQDQHIDLNSLCDGQQIIENVDQPDRLGYFSDAISRSESAVVNYKLRLDGLPFELSLNLVTASALKGLCALEEDKTSVLYWNESFKGVPLLARDFAGRDNFLSYEEEETKFGNRLIVPNFTPTKGLDARDLGLFCPFATMPMPCYDALFSDTDIDGVLSAFLLSVERLKTDFAAHELTTEYGNLHIRKDRFSPFLREKTSELFPFLLPPLAQG